MAVAAIAQRLFRGPRTRRRHLRVTREGKVFLLVAVGVGIAALNTGNNLMYLTMGFMLSLIVLSGVLSELAIRGLRVTRTLPGRAFAGEPILIELDVYNAKARVPSYSIEIEDRADGEVGGRRCYLLKVEPQAMRSVTYRRKVLRRGEFSLASVRIGTRYPFSLFDKWRVQDLSERFLVFPARETWDVDAHVAGQGPADAGRAAGRSGETRELREYRARDEVRRIHWRRSAAAGRPIVREMEDEASRAVCLAIDNARPAGDADFERRFESAVARTAFAVERLLARGASVEVVVRGERSARLVAGASPDPIWRFLATLPAVDVESAGDFAPSRSGIPPLVVEGSETP